MSDIERIQERLRRFADERDWGQYHTPKNLAMALAGEAGELLAELQWLTPEESQLVMEDDHAGAAVRGELADVAIYLFRLADVLDVDLGDAAMAKIETNEGRFPSLPSPASSLTDEDLVDLWKRIWESATDEVDDRGRRRHTAGVKWLLDAYGISVRTGAGPHGPVRQDVLARLETMGAIERVGGGEAGRTRSLWVTDPRKTST